MTLPSVHYASHHSRSGYGVAGRRLARALTGIGVQVRWTPVVFDPANPKLAPEIRDEDMGLAQFRDVATEPDVLVLHTIPELIPALSTLARRGEPIVCHTVWEHDVLQDHWAGLLNQTDGVIVPTQWNADTFRRCGVTVPIEVVPHIVAAEVPDARWLEQPPIVLADDFMVGSIAQWSTRKSPWVTLDAFARAFSDPHDAVLVLRTTDLVVPPLVPPPGPPHLRHLTSWWTSTVLFAHYPPARVHLATEERTFEEIAGFHRRNDCWISLPHSEGWDLGTFDAAASGTPVITTAYGGPLEYLDPEASFLVPGQLTPHHEMPWFEWIDPDATVAIEALREVRNGSAAITARAQEQGERLRVDYAPDRVATMFLNALARMSVL
jgi:glycosyltransferase involved in cell wall biosynthesis